MNFNEIRGLNQIEINKIIPDRGIDAGTKLKNNSWEIFVEPRYTGGNFTNWGNHSPIAVANAASVYFQFMVPGRAKSLISADIVGLADATETIQFDIGTDIGTDAEGATTHTDSIVDQTKSVVANTIWFQSIVDGLGGISANDLVGVKLTSNTDYLFITGLRLRFS